MADRNSSPFVQERGSVLVSTDCNIQRHPSNNEREPRVEFKDSAVLRIDQYWQRYVSSVHKNLPSMLSQFTIVQHTEPLENN